jgi:prepilin-type N-terminal cleavage/methylation domain-containing protein/prepilin-type processing-associated H-X9-DG protein
MKERHGFTLVELLVVIAIIGMLVALLLPAIQAARESGRRIECANHFKQLSLACLNHVSDQKFYPTGGWGWCWVGDPNRGFGIAQPGGWTYNILPYLEFHSLYDMGKGIQQSAASKQGNTERVQTPVSLYICPSRRAVKTYPITGGQPINTNSLSGLNVAKTDYAISCGTGNSDSPSGDDETNAGPSSYSNGDTPPPPTGNGYNWPDYSTPGSKDYQGGLSYVRSRVTQEMVFRGVTHVILLGEKFINSAQYTSGDYPGDNEELFVGQDNDTSRTTYYPPQQDVMLPVPLPNTAVFVGNNGEYCFGSAHPGGCNFSAADGSVHFISYSVNPALFADFGVRTSKATPDTIWDQ